MRIDGLKITGRFSLRVLTEGREWVNEFPILFEINGRKRLVERGYITDLVSRPWFTNPFIRKWGRWTLAALKHDPDYWWQDTSRAAADRDFMDIGLACGAHPIDARAVWFALRVGGWLAWRNNAKRKRHESAFYDGDLEKLPVAEIAAPPGIITPDGWPVE